MMILKKMKSPFTSVENKKQKKKEKEKEKDGHPVSMRHSWNAG